MIHGMGRTLYDVATYNPPERFIPEDWYEEEPSSASWLERVTTGEALPTDTPFPDISEPGLNTPTWTGGQPTGSMAWATTRAVLRARLRSR